MGWGVAIIIIILIIIVWGVVGSTWPSSGSNGATPQGEGCAACKGLDNWWQGLTAAGKTKMAAWYSWKKTDCLLKNCGTGEVK